MRERPGVRNSGATRRRRSCRTVSSEVAESLGMGRPAKKEKTLQQTADLHYLINDARELIYGACWKLIRAQDIVVDEKDTLDRLQVLVQVLRNYADRELTQIK